jgi:hypothetical protein
MEEFAGSLKHTQAAHRGMKKNSTISVVPDLLLRE